MAVSSSRISFGKEIHIPSLPAIYEEVDLKEIIKNVVVKKEYVKAKKE